MKITKKQLTEIITESVQKYLNEVMGYNMKASDKKFISSWINGNLKEGDNNQRLSIEKGNILSGVMSNLARIKDMVLYYGYAYGNVSQTYINYIKKTAKQNGLTLKYSEKIY